MRAVMNVVMYILSTGCQWRYLPKDFPPRSTVHNYFVWWHCDGVLDRIHHALYVECREKLFAMWRYYKKHEESLLARAEREMAQQDRR
jgi:transposase